MATDLKRGEECVVATPNEDGDIEFVWFSFTHENIMPDENGVATRVQFGKRLQSQTLPKAKAAKTEPYSPTSTAISRDHLSSSRDNKQSLS